MFPTARLCEYCHKGKGVTFHVLFLNGRATSYQAHPHCFKKRRNEVIKEEKSHATQRKELLD